MRIYVLLKDWENYSEGADKEFVGVFFTIEALIAKLEKCAKYHKLENTTFDQNDIEITLSNLEFNQYSKNFIDIQPVNKFDWCFQYYVKCCDAI